MFEQSPINEESTVLMTKLMQMSLERQKVIANNIANASTPGYIRKEIGFEDQLAKLLKNNDFDSVKELNADVFDDLTDSPRMDGNNVRVTKEMNAMIQNNVFYSLMTKAFATKMNMIKSAIQGK